MGKIYRGLTRIGSTVEVKGGMDRLQWKCDNMKTLEQEFYYCPSEDVDEIINGLDTSKVTNFTRCFAYSTGVKKHQMDLSSATNLQGMYTGCSNLNDVSGFKFGSTVSNVGSLFSNCKSLQDISALNNCDFSQVTNISYILQQCSNVTMPKHLLLNLPKATTFTYAFEQMGTAENPIDCVELTSLNNKPNLQYIMRTAHIKRVILKGSDITSNLTSTFQGEYNNSSLEELYFDGSTSNCTNIRDMCYNQRKLHTLEGLDMLSVTDASTSFGYCYNLQNLILKNIRLAINTSASDNLTDASLINTAKELWDLTGGTSQTLILSSKSKARLNSIYVKLIDITDEMRAEDEYIDNKKACVVCESTDEGAMTLTEYIVSKNWTIR